MKHTPASLIKIKNIATFICLILLIYISFDNDTQLKNGLK